MINIEKHNKYWSLLVLTSLLSLIAIFYSISNIHDNWLRNSFLVFGIITPILALKLRNTNRISFLVTLIPTIIIIRAADQNDISMIGWITALSLIPLFLQFIGIAKKVYKKDQFEFGLVCIRLFVGFNFLTHGTEKLFAGAAVHDGMRGFFGQVAGFDQIGHGFTNFMIYLAGFTEIGVAVMIGAGLFTRLGSFIAIGYLIAAELFSGHFGIGYTWASPGGGWEFPFFWAMILYPFLFMKLKDEMTLDYILKKALLTKSGNLS